jgi:gamma-glutamyltranspeptidase/glutathione hydrolase
LICSVFSSFGSGLVAGETGVILQNRAANFSMDPASPNVVAPGKRCYNTIIPGMASRDGKPLMAFGVMGGGMQPQGHLQVIANMVDFGMTAQDALDAPRFRIGSAGQLAVEPDLAPIVPALENLGHKTSVSSKLGYYGGGQIVMRDGETLVGASDPRKDGIAVGF